MPEPSADLISLPKGGGALRAVGDTFQPDPHTGTGHYRVPLDLPPGRGALTPRLALTYSSADGTGPFGLGWSLTAPGIRRRTDKRLPRYDNTDTFVLSGAEPLVPVPGAMTVGAQRFRPETETLFGRIEHLTADGDHWIVHGRDGLRSTYGTPRPAAAPSDWRDPAVIADPQRPDHILAWLITSTVDTLGNTIVYTYAPDPADPAGPQRYLAAIGYADHGDPANPGYLVRVRLAYDPRPDPHTDRRGGFPVTTGQRCAAIETWTDTGTPQLTRTVALTYSDGASRGDNGTSLLTRITVTGHDGTTTESLPPLEFGYRTWDPSRRGYRSIGDPAAGTAPPRSLADRSLDLVDLFGTGLPDLLQLAGGVGRYWRNRGGGRLDLPRGLAAAPADAPLGTAGVQLLDADGDGRPDLLVTDGRRAGYFPIGCDGGFDPAGYVALREAPPFRLDDPATRLIDLDGDGVVDALHLGTTMVAYLNDRTGGWSSLPADPGSPLLAVSFTDPRVRLADMTGDGLTDVVLIDNGRLTYWPNLGYGRFGDPVAMTASPRFDDSANYGPTGYDPARLLIGDVDGDGVADVVYVGPFGTTVWINRCGAGFAPPVVVPATPRPDNAASVRLADMLGIGVNGVLWSYDAGRVRCGNYKFLDLTGGTKPYLLTGVDNHAGAATTITYAPSTGYAEADAAAGRPWRTTLPFPVHVVAAVVVEDHFSQTRLSSAYDYHHGYWDGADREFRGFGRVEQRDTLTSTGPGGDGALSPPTQTRSWFHLGPVGPEHGAWTDLDLRDEYWSGDPPLTAHVDDTGLPPGLPRRASRAAVRAARGTLLREELFALDGTPNEARPYEVSDHAVALAPVLDGRVGTDPGWQAAQVITAHPTVSRHTVWERGTDPMCRVQVTGTYDDYGRPADQVDVAVPRGHDPRHADPAAAAEPYLAVRTTTTYATTDDMTGYLTDRVTSVRRAQLDATTGIAVLPLAAAVLAGAVGDTVRALTFTFYDGPAGAGPTASAGQLGGLAFGRLGPYGLPTRTEELVSTPDRLTSAGQPGAGTRLPAGPPAYLPVGGTPPATLGPEYPPAFTAGLAPLAGYTWHDAGTNPATGATYVAGYYRHATRHAYDVHTDPAGRGLPVAHRDALGHDTTIVHDGYQLLPTTVTDPLGLTHTAEYDYRTLKPTLVTEPNGNRAQAGYTPLGLLAWTAATGKATGRQGDTIDQPGVAYTYDLSAWDTGQRPISVTTTRRVDHRWTVVDRMNATRAAAGQPPLTDAEIAGLFPPDEASRYPERFVGLREFSDGLGRRLEIRRQADTLVLDALGLTADHTVPVGPARAHRVAATDPVPVVVSSWRRYDNKGRVITAWEPSYATGWDYQRPDAAILAGLASTTTTYDPRGLAILVTGPDGAQTVTVPGVPPDLSNPASYAPTPWATYVYDPDDNAGRTHPGEPYPDQFDTPSSTTVDALGRATVHVRRVAPSDVGAAVTVTAYDIDGNVVSVTDPLGRVVATTDYDCLNRPWRHAGADAGVTRTVHDPADGILESRDDKGAITLHGHDAGHRPTYTWAADTGGQLPTLRERTVHGDDPVDGPATAAAAANLLGRVWRAYDEAGLRTTEGYDLDGHPLAHTRQVLRTDLLLNGLPAGADTWDGTAYTVDWQPTAGQTLDAHAAGLLDPTPLRTDHTYDALSRVTGTTAPQSAGGTRTLVTYTHTPTGQLTSITADGTPHLSTVLYNPRGQRVLAVLNDTTLIRYVHDPRTFRLTRLRAETATTDPTGPQWTIVPATVAQDYGYDYDLVGNMRRLTDRTPAAGLPTGMDAAHSPNPDVLVREFGYDPLYRLRTATGREAARAPAPPWQDTPAGADVTKAQPYQQSYDYDLADHLARLTHTSATGYVRDYRRAPDSNRLTGLVLATGDTFDYASDPAGNVVREAITRRYEWDHTDRLATFRVQTDGAVPSVYAQYRYDPDGRRVLKIVRHGTGAPDVTVYIDGLFERIVDGTTGAAHDATHLLDDVTRIAVLRHGSPLPGDPYPDATYHLGDHLTSSTAVLDRAGSVLNREEYTPFGETSFGSYARKRYRYTAKERDEESRLGYHQARYYAPWLARWVGPDPAQMADGVNLFCYARGNPVNHTDRTGLASEPKPDSTAKPGGSAQATPKSRSKAPVADLRRRTAPASVGPKFGADQRTTPRHILGWSKQEANRVGKNAHRWRNPPGYDAGHPWNAKHETHGDTGGALEWEFASDNRFNEQVYRAYRGGYKLKTQVLPIPEPRMPVNAAGPQAPKPAALPEPRGLGMGILGKVGVVAGFGLGMYFTQLAIRDTYNDIARGNAASATANALGFASGASGLGAIVLQVLGRPAAGLLAFGEITGIPALLISNFLLGGERAQQLDEAAAEHPEYSTELNMAKWVPLLPGLTM